MKLRGGYIDLNNTNQVRWFNTWDGKLFKVVAFDTVMETATNKKVGYIIYVKDNFIGKFVTSHLLKLYEEAKK